MQQEMWTPLIFACPGRESSNGAYFLTAWRICLSKNQAVLKHISLLNNKAQCRDPTLALGDCIPAAEMTEGDPTVPAFQLHSLPRTRAVSPDTRPR